MIRLYFYEQQRGLLWTIVLLMVGCLFVLGGINLWSYSAVLAVIFCWIPGIFFWLISSAVLIVFLILLPSRIRLSFCNGLLTAAVVERVREPSLIHIAVLSNDGNPATARYGVKRGTYPLFPKQWLVEGKRIPCVSYFRASKDDYSQTWYTFIPTPIMFGTSDHQRIDECLQAIEHADGDEPTYFEILDRFLDKNKVEEGFGGTYVCDGEGNLLEKRSDLETASLKESEAMESQ